MEIPHNFLFDELLVKSIAVDPQQQLLAASEGQRILLFKIRGGFSEQLQLLQTEELMTPYEVTYLQFTDGGDLIAAGHADSAAGDQSWNDLRGGGCIIFDSKGVNRRQLSFDDIDLAWGNGARTLVFDNSSHHLYGLDRHAQLYSFCIQTGARRLLWRVRDKESLGIGHAAMANGLIVCGYNRGGYRLHVYHCAALLAKSELQLSTA